jgi:hypothetical protein
MTPAMQKDFAGVMNKMLGAEVDLSVLNSFYSTK